MKLFKQYFEYGLYKPLVLRKIRSGLKLRHLIPAIFTCYLATLLFIYEFYWWLPLGLYIIGSLAYAVINPLNLKARFFVFISFFIIHIAYGSGFIAGLFKSSQIPATHVPEEQIA